MQIILSALWILREVLQATDLLPPKDDQAEKTAKKEREEKNFSVNDMH